MGFLYVCDGSGTFLKDFIEAEASAPPPADARAGPQGLDDRTKLLRSSQDALAR
jgi:hypothetical protein